MNDSFNKRIKEKAVKYSQKQWGGDPQFEAAFAAGTLYGYDIGVQDSTAIVQAFAESGNIDNYTILSDRLESLLTDKEEIVSLFEQILKHHEDLFKKLAKSEKEDKKSSCVVCFNLKCTCKPRG